MQLDHRLVAALIGIMDYPHGLRSHRVRRWNPDREAVEFSVILRPYEGIARIARRVFQRLLDQSPTPERCMEAFHLQRTRFELIVERKLRRRQLTDDGNIEITGRDLREKNPALSQRDLFDQRVGRRTFEVNTAERIMLVVSRKSDRPPAE